MIYKGRKKMKERKKNNIYSLFMLFLLYKFDEEKEKKDARRRCEVLFINLLFSWNEKERKRK